jgi:hypothetical protein
MAGGRNARNLHWIVSALLRIADDTMDWTTQPPPPSFLTQHEAGTLFFEYSAPTAGLTLFVSSSE